MTRAAQVLAESPRPAVVVVLPASVWVATWAKRPVGEVAIGLRFLSQQESEMATTAAEARADQSRMDGDARDTVYNDELMVQVAGFAACDPNDATRRHFDLGSEDVRVALTSQGVRRLWDEFERAQVGSSPLVDPADDTDLGDLAECLLDPDGLAHLSPTDDLMVRRWARSLLDLLRPATP